MFPVDLPRGAEWMIKGADTPSLRVQTAPFGRCWFAFGYQVQVELEHGWLWSILDRLRRKSYIDTVDGRNPAPVEQVELGSLSESHLFLRLLYILAPRWLVQDFFEAENRFLSRGFPPSIQGGILSIPFQVRLVASLRKRPF